MANTVFKLRRSSVAGKVPNTSTLSIGELGLNLTDQKLFSSDGSSVFELGANVTNQFVYSTLSVGNSSVNTVVNSSSITVKSIVANGSVGATNQVLTSNGSGIYWTDPTGGGTGSVGGSNTQIQFNDSGSANGSAGFTFDKTSNIISVGNSSVNVTINSTSFSGTANNTSFVGSVSAANVVSNAQLSANLSNYQTTTGLAANVATLAANSATYANSSSTNTFTVGTAAYFVANGNFGVGNNVPTDKFRVEGTQSVLTSLYVGNSSVNTFVNSSSLTVKSIIANGSVGTANQVLTSNGSGIYWTNSTGSSAAKVYSRTSATSGQNVFTTSATFDTNLVDVYYNGVHLSNADFAVVNTTAIQLTSSATLGAIVEIAAYNSISTTTIDWTSYPGSPTKIYTSTTATAGQNTFTTSSAFSSGNIDVYYNGVHLSRSDYSEIDTSTIKLNFNAFAGDIIEISGYNSTLVLGSPVTLDMAVDNFSGTGSNTNFGISVQTTTNKSFVFINGVLQNPSNAYSIYGNVVAFSAAPSNNDLIEVRSPYFLNVNTTNITAVVGNNTVQFTNTAYVVSNNQTVNATTQTAIDSYDATLYRTAKYLVQIKDNNANNFQCDEIMVTHDGTTSYIFVFGEIATNTVIATFDSNLVSNNVSLLLTSTSSNTTTKVVRTMLTV